MGSGAPRADESRNPARCHPMAPTGDRRPAACLDTVMPESARKQKRLKTVHASRIGRCLPLDSSAHSERTPSRRDGRSGVGGLRWRRSHSQTRVRSLVDRVGPGPVRLVGLVGFATASATFAIAGDPGLLGVARFGQGAAAAAFYLAASTLVAWLTPTGGHGRP